MREPNLFLADDISNEWPTKSINTAIDTFSDPWVLARPKPSNYGIARRLHITLGVLTGKYDAVRWQ
jgi:hypothetical protein